MSRRDFSLNDIHLALDGELSADDRADFEHWLDAHPDMKALTARFERDRATLAAALAPVLDEPVPARLTKTAQGEAKPRRSWQALFALALRRLPSCWSVGGAAAICRRQRLDERGGGRGSVSPRTPSSRLRHLRGRPAARVEVGGDRQGLSRQLAVEADRHEARRAGSRRRRFRHCSADAFCRRARRRCAAGVQGRRRATSCRSMSPARGGHGEGHRHYGRGRRPDCHLLA